MFYEHTLYSLRPPPKTGVFLLLLGKLSYYYYYYSLLTSLANGGLRGGGGGLGMCQSYDCSAGLAFASHVTIGPTNTHLSAGTLTSPTSVGEKLVWATLVL
jgi:hypothetical protein